MSVYRSQLTPLILALVVGFAPGGPVASAGETTVEVLELEYWEWESGGEPYASRVLVTPGFMRLDFGVDDGGYVLFDRGAATVYSVQAEDGRILEIAAADGADGGIGAPPVPLDLAQRSQGDEDAPLVADERPVNTDYTVNGELCQQTVSVPGLLPEAVTAWREFGLLMAAQRATTLANTPPEFRRPCSLANTIYAPTRYLQHGLPIREHHRDGISRELRGFEHKLEQAALFGLPEGFQRFRIGEGL